MQNLLVTAYKMFRMFVGLFTDIPADVIYTKCQQFFTPVSFQQSHSYCYATLKLTSIALHLLLFHLFFSTYFQDV